MVPDGAPFRYPGWEAEGAGQAREPEGGVLEEGWLSGHWPCSRKEGKHQRLLGSGLVYLWGLQHLLSPSHRSLARLPDLLWLVLCTRHSVSLPALLSLFPLRSLFSFCLFLIHLALICLPHLFDFIRKQKDVFKDVTIVPLAGPF